MKNVDMTKISSVKLEIKHEGLSDSFLDMRLGNLYCKHMIKCSNTGNVASKANRLFAASDALGYEFPIVKSCDESALRSSISDVLGAVSSAYFRYEMSNSRDLIDVGYLVDDLLYDNPELLI